MKNLFFILTAFFFTVALNAQQTEDEVHIGTYPKGKTFGNYKGPDTKPINGQLTVTGIVIGSGVVSHGLDSLTDKRRVLYSFDLKKDDGTIVTVGTRDHGFTVPKEIVGKKIIIEGIEPGTLIRERKTVKKDYQKDIQFAAKGIKVID